MSVKSQVALSLHRRLYGHLQILPPSFCRQRQTLTLCGQGSKSFLPMAFYSHYVWLRTPLGIVYISLSMELGISAIDLTATLA